MLNNFIDNMCNVVTDNSFDNHVGKILNSAMEWSCSKSMVGIQLFFFNAYTNEISKWIERQGLLGDHFPTRAEYPEQSQGRLHEMLLAHLTHWRREKW